jgi:hypothetical protein
MLYAFLIFYMRALGPQCYLPPFDCAIIIREGPDLGDPHYAVSLLLRPLQQNQILSSAFRYDK